MHDSPHSVDSDRRRLGFYPVNPDELQSGWPSEGGLPRPHIPSYLRDHATSTEEPTVERTDTEHAAKQDRAPQSKRGEGVSPVTQALLTMAMLGMTLAASRFVVPDIIEHARFAWRRGELRAEYASSKESLQNVGLDSLAMAYQMVSQQVGPSVTHIEVWRQRSLGDTPLNTIRHDSVAPPAAAPLISDQGSGVIVDCEDGFGYIVTNHHVIVDGRHIRVGLSDGRRVDAELIGSDPLTDLALLRVRADGLIPAQWGDSDSTEVGTPVWAVGSPFGLDHTVTFGILSGKHRAAKAGTHYQDFMQSDVAVNPGNSGGPLVDTRGQLIGINTAIVGDTYRGVSFSIPSNVAKRVYQRLRESGRFERGWLGVQLAEVPDEMVEGGNLRTRGALVIRLTTTDSPAAQAGLAADDIIVRFDGRPVVDMSDLMRMVGNWPAGEEATIDILRNNVGKSLQVRIGTRPERFN